MAALHARMRAHSCLLWAGVAIVVFMLVRVCAQVAAKLPRVDLCLHVCQCVPLPVRVFAGGSSTAHMHLLTCSLVSAVRSYRVSNGWWCFMCLCVCLQVAAKLPRVDPCLRVC